LSREHQNKFGSKFPESCSIAYHLKKLKTSKKNQIETQKKHQTKQDTICLENSCIKTIFKSHLRKLINQTLMGDDREQKGETHTKVSLNSELRRFFLKKIITSSVQKITTHENKSSLRSK
jgi:hypothetical protein